MQSEVSSAQQLADYPEVGGMAAHQGERRLGAQQLGDGGLQLAVQRTLPGGDPARRHRSPVPGYGLGGGGDDSRMAGQPQIVEAGEVQQNGAADAGGCPERTLVGYEVRIRYAEPLGEQQASGQGRDLGEWVGSVVVARTLLAGGGRCGLGGTIGSSGRRHAWPHVQVASWPRV